MITKKDLFYAMSHGVNRATLKEGTEDERIIFLDKLWPDFTKLDLQDCIKQFSKVERRFGQRL